MLQLSSTITKLLADRPTHGRDAQLHRGSRRGPALAQFAIQKGHDSGVGGRGIARALQPKAWLANTDHQRVR